MSTVKKSLGVIGVSTLFALSTACQNEGNNNASTPKERVDITLTRTEQGLLDASTSFAFDFFRQVNTSETKKPNFFISPLSASLCLSMIANGADHNTLSEMLRVLGFPADTYTIDDMNSYHKKLVEALLNLDNTTQLAIANSIWIKEGFGVYNDFINVNKQMYDAQVRELDFTSPNAVDIINRWCADNTNNLITDVLQEIPSNVRLYLINALYFKGIWKEKFKTENTRKEPFTNEDGKQSTIQMMSQEKRFPYYQDDNMAMVNLPYGNGAFSMVVMLPHEGKSLDACIQALTAEQWKAYNAQLYGCQIDLKLPRFKMEYDKDLKDDMKTLGLKDAFDPIEADFSQMAKESLYVSLLKQFTYLNVDEEGTEAAAVTIGGMGLTSIEPRESVPFHVNRPFAFFIKEHSTGAILFMGKVTEL
ncbi:MAG: serpin family protein [Prevotellaceae bacterium]|jgi:serpin B|nr:serpin family protein [Prevotellaceae bacterium]